jgi:phosphoribosylformimino-5-aminoimidazole carboxamide ribotide isomerase
MGTEGWTASILLAHRRWTVYPAMDLRRGRVVRLMQGDPDRETQYADEPLHVARRWWDAGARWLHVVNLDGALGSSAGDNLAALKRVLDCAPTTGLRVQFGGGLRDLASIRRVLGLGVSRAVIGTAAVEDPALVEAALTAFGPERVAVGIDARDGRVRTHGWQQDTEITALELAHRWADSGVHWVIFTDVARDGMSTGLNLDATVSLARETGLNVIASGGVASLEDVRRTYRAGLSGVIIGRALYEGQIALEDALRIHDA